MIDPQASAGAILQKLASGGLTAVNLMTALAPARARTEALGGTIGDPLNTAAAALASDRRRDAGEEGPLEGLPISIKANLGVDGLPTSAGTPAFADYRLAEGGVVARLRAAGAVIALRTNLHELAFGVTGANTWSGDALNPFDEARLAGGSSAGAAISVAVGAVAVAVGTDTGGSCRVPAAHCGVVGFRPTTGRYPVDGCVGLSPSRDTPGLLARSVLDIALVDAVIAGELPLSLVAPAGLRLGVIRFAPIDPAVAERFDAVLATLAAAGIQLEGRDLSAAIAADDACGFVIAVYESARSLEALAADALGLDLAAFAETIASPDVRELVAAEAGPAAVPEAVYREAIDVHLPQLRAAFAAALGGVDALIYPTAVLPAPLVDVGATVSVGSTTMPTFPAYTMTTRPDSMAGQPTVSLPMGLADGLPVGLQLCGARGADRDLLAIAACVEALLPPRPIPA